MGTTLGVLDEVASELEARCELLLATKIRQISLAASLFLPHKQQFRRCPYVALRFSLSFHRVKTFLLRREAAIADNKGRVETGWLIS